jgi:hypothetical protein
LRNIKLNVDFSLTNQLKLKTKSNTFFSSPAASFYRIEIKYGKFEEMIISPKNKFEFAKNLTNLNPKIKNNITIE